MIARIRAGSLTTDSLSAIGLCRLDFRQGRGAGDGPALEQQVPGFLLDEHGRAVVLSVSGSIAMNIAP